MRDGTRSAAARRRRTVGRVGLHRFDEITADDLRASGSLKWTAFPGTLAAWIAEMDFGIAPPITAALHEAVDRGVTGYLPTGLARDLARACADWQRDVYGWTVPAERIHPVTDVLAALRITAEHFAAPGAPLILPTPAYMPFVAVPRAWGREVIQVPMAADGGRPVHDLDGLDRAMAAAGGGLLVLVNPHNPTGRVFTVEELTALSEVVDRNGARVFADEIHAPITYPGHRHVPYASLSPTTAAHTVTATSASKAWNLPGLTCAQLVFSTDEDAATWERTGLTGHGVGTLGVVGSTVAYTAGREWLTEVLAYLEMNRRRFAELVRELPGVAHRPPEGTYLAWLDLRSAGPDGAGWGDHPARELRRRAGVALTEGAACGDAGRGFVRFNLAMPRPLLEEAVDRIGTALIGRRGR